MKFFHIIQVSESALRAGSGDRGALERAVGAAVIDACIGPAVGTGSSTGAIVECREAAKRQGLIRYVHEFADRDLAFFAAVEGELRSATELSRDLLDEGISLLAIYKRHPTNEDVPHP